MSTPREYGCYRCEEPAWPRRWQDRDGYWYCENCHYWEVQMAPNGVTDLTEYREEE